MEVSTPATTLSRQSRLQHYYFVNEIITKFRKQEMIGSPQNNVAPASPTQTGETPVLLFQLREASLFCGKVPTHTCMAQDLFYLMLGASLEPGAWIARPAFGLELLKS
jgi:hypothetical protein